MLLIRGTRNGKQKIIGNEVTNGDRVKSVFFFPMFNCISAHNHFKKFARGKPLDHPRKLVAFGHSGRLPQQTINPRLNPAD